MKNLKPTGPFTLILKFVLILTLITTRCNSLFAQIYIPNTTIPNPVNISTVPPGQYYNDQSITLSPDFVAAPTGTDSYRFYILNNPPLNAAASQNQNYIITYIPRVKGIKNTSMLYNRTSDELIESIAYFDGIGRPSQTVQIKGSAANHDAVQPVVYDQYGKESVKYLPYALTNNAVSDGSFKPNAITDQIAFYNPTSPGAPGIATTPFTFSKTVFENSPLNRVLEQGAPGNDWQPVGTLGVSGNIGHTVKLTYGVNGQNEVKLWQLNTDGTHGANWSNNYYTVGQLSKTTTTDENGHYSIGFKDKNGLVVCKQVQGPDNLIETNYVYDDLNNLAYVIPPIPVNVTYPTSFTENFSDPVFYSYLYGYHYDMWNRIIEKKIPGKGWDYMVYNSLDQVVATQDAKQRAAGIWLFTKYDGQGRIIGSGVWNNGGTVIDRLTLQNTVNTQTTANGVPITYWETYTGAGNGYSATAWPQNSIVHFLTVNYYDNYAFPNNPYGPAVSGTVSNPTGLLTATKTCVLLPDGIYGAMLWASNYYDDLGRVVETYKQHYLGGESSASTNNHDDTQITYNFDNTVATTQRFHYINSASNTATQALVVGNSYFYDHMGRKKQTYTAVNSTPSVLLSQVNYNEVGQVLTKQLHSSNNGSSFLQNINYTYNERGWLRTSTTDGNLFNLDLRYNDQTFTTPQFNGNIANQYWVTNGGSQNNYGYTYDALNRLNSGIANTGNNETGITYDLAGNIKTLVRTGVNNVSLSYDTYNGNQLQLVNNNGTAYRTYGTYDGNGNAPTDGLGNGITYNLLNLPATIANKGLTYTYDVAGNKLRRIANGTVTEYIDGIQYTGTTIDFVQTEEGRILNLTGTPNYEYTLSDHLGNTRVTFDSNTGGSTAKQADDYYPFGFDISGNVSGTKNEYLYNKKESQEQVGLNQYDYGARFYDPVIGRFTTIDPLAEMDRRWSSYSYGHNNPITHIDVDGMFDWVKDQEGNIKWDKDANSQATTKQGETYLGKTLAFNFNSYIDKNLWDGPLGSAPAGDKLTTTVYVTGNENEKGELTGISAGKHVAVGETPIGAARDYYPGLGGNQNAFDVKANADGGFSLNMEQHASVSSLEEFGMRKMGYNIVNVAQKLGIDISSNGNVSTSAATDIFPSATLSINGSKVMKYDQPSFINTHSMPNTGHYSVPTSGGIGVNIYNEKYKPAQWFNRK